MTRYVAEVVIDNRPEAADITGLFDGNGDDTTDLDKAWTMVLRCSRGYITVPIDAVPIFTVH